MLVLTRKPSEEIVCQLPSGQEVRIVVLDVRGDKVRLGIGAPRDVPVFRSELLTAPQPVPVKPVKEEKPCAL